MNLTIFQSDKGDCLLLEAKTKQLVLCDGGMRPSMRNHVRAELGALRKSKRDLALVYVSHIDNDHISGVLQLLEDEVEWRVFDHHKKNGRPVKQPTVPRPPKIKGILYNGFREQITKNNKPLETLGGMATIEQLLGAMAPSLLATAEPQLMDVGDEMQEIATGVPEGLKVSKLIAAEALAIPLNRPPGVQKGGKLLYAGRPGEKFQIGSMNFTLVGPTVNELRSLRDGWNNWLRDNQDKMKKLRAQIRKSVDEFSQGVPSASPFDLSTWEGIEGYKGVTVPNIASLMFLVEEDGKRILLTGDAQQAFILEGLNRSGVMSSGSLHLDVLKVQHHGSEHNVDIEFARTVSADHYVFCGNGEHANPDLRVIDIIYKSRLGSSAVCARAPEAANRPFNFWFSTTSKAQPKGTTRRKHFEELEKKVKSLAAKSHGLLKLHFNQKASIVLSV